MVAGAGFEGDESLVFALDLSLDFSLDFSPDLSDDAGFASFASDESPFESVAAGAESVPAEPLRLSVAYQPLPLKTIAGGVSSRLASLPQSRHGCTGGASKPSRFS